MNVVIAFLALVVPVAIVLLVRRTLRQRPRARDLRNRFIALAEDLVGKPEFPETHARHLVELAAMREGWITRLLVMAVLWEMVSGRSVRAQDSELSFEQVPENLRGKYIVAILSIVLSDSYRCAILGRVLRGTFAWMSEAIEDVKPDINAHATRGVVNRVNVIHARRHVPASRALATA